MTHLLHYLMTYLLFMYLFITCLFICFSVYLFNCLFTYLSTYVFTVYYSAFSEHQTTQTVPFDCWKWSQPNLTEKSHENRPGKSFVWPRCWTRALRIWSSSAINITVTYRPDSWSTGQVRKCPQRVTCKAFVILMSLDVKIRDSFQQTH